VALLAIIEYRMRYVNGSGGGDSIVVLGQYVVENIVQW
jgi:hypothetical protein